MTEAKTLELFGAYGQCAQTAMTIYISITFGYLATAYFVGSQLTTIQVCTGSALYLVGVGAAFLNQVVCTQSQFKILDSVPNVLQDLTLIQGDFWLLLLSILQTLGVIASLFFMWQIRHPKTK